METEQHDAKTATAGGAKGGHMQGGHGMPQKMQMGWGRFAAMMPGAPALVLPAGPEIAHVVEDCRA